MSAKDDPREELASVAASLRAYLEWQVDTGASGIPRGRRKAAATEASAPPRPMAERHAAAGHGASHEETREERRDDADRNAHDPATKTPQVAGSAEAQAPSREAFSSSDRHAPESAREPAPVVAPAPAVVGHASAATSPSRARLPILAAEVASCTKCGLAKTRTQTVFSRGNPAATICFIGEAPGADEDAQGLPFVGRAGQLLDKMIQAMGLSPENDVYVCNIIKCRPPDNRKPETEEMDTCIPYLHEQLAIVAPKVIVAMGNTAVQALLQTKMGITKVRGSWKLYKGSTLVMPTYHPSYLLRPSAQQAEAKRQAWEDLQAVMKELKLPIPPKKG